MAATLERQRDYVFTPPSVEERLRQAAGQKLATWVTGHEPKTPEEVVSCQVLRERYLEPHLTTQSQYKARLDMQARGAPVPPIKGIPILLLAGKTQHFALRASAHAANVRLEHKLRYNYAKLKARGQLRTRTRYASATKVAASAGQSGANKPPTRTTSGGERPRSRDDHGHDAQKPPKHMGSIAEGVPQIPISFQTQSTHATLPDTGIGPDDDVVSVVSRHGIDDTHAHRAKLVGAHEKLVLGVNGSSRGLGLVPVHAGCDAKPPSGAGASSNSERGSVGLDDSPTAIRGSALVVGASASKFT
uniref:Uncharacterized protein n=1 Tax=Peronospora matthiolae TaxID=2874970 RepID=A0AAV1VGJ8_9STRA